MSRMRSLAATGCILSALVLGTAACIIQDEPKTAAVSTPTPSLSTALDAPRQMWPPIILPPQPSATMEAKVIPIPPAAKATRLYYPGVSVNASLDSYTSSNGVLDPPGTRADSERLFALEPYSSQAGMGATNTFYVIAHSYDDGTGVMNRIMARAKVGQIFTIGIPHGKVCYQVKRISIEKKQDIMSDTADANKRRPGWAVFITCHAAPGDPSTVWGSNSSVLYAQMQPCAA